MWYTGRDSTYVPQARNFYFENKFSSEGCLAKCHWHFSPRPLGVENSNSRSTRKSPDRSRGVFVVHREGFEPPTLCSEDRCSNPLSYRCAGMRQTYGFSHRSSAKPSLQANQARCSFPYRTSNVLYNCKVLFCNKAPEAVGVFGNTYAFSGNIV
jgi:hypothetical protein